MLWQESTWGKEKNKHLISVPPLWSRCSQKGAAFFKMSFLTYTTNYFSCFGVDILILSWTRPTFLCILPLPNMKLLKNHCHSPTTVDVLNSYPLTKFQPGEMWYAYEIIWCSTRWRIAQSSYIFLHYSCVVTWLKTQKHWYGLPDRAVKYWMWAKLVYGLTTYKKMCQILVNMSKKSHIIFPSVNLTK